MDHQLVKHLMRNPRAQCEFQLTGRLPRVRKSDATPLRNLIEQIPRGMWPLFRGVRLSPILGFETSLMFSGLDQLYYWLGGGQTLVGNQTLPYMHYRIHRFDKVLTVNDLIPFCGSIPDIDALKKRLPVSIYRHSSD